MQSEADKKPALESTVPCRMDSDRDDSSFRHLFENAPQPMWVCERDRLAVLAANEAALRHYGYTRAEFLTLTAAELFLAEELPGFRRRGAADALPASSEQPSLDVWRQRKKDGTTVEMELAVSHVSFQGQAAFLVVAHDVTERRRVEESLRESEERHRLIAELTSDYAYTCRVYADGPIVMESATAGFSRVTGYASVPQLEERGGWASLIHPEDLGGVMEKQAALLTGKRDVNEVRLLTRDGELRWIRYSVHPIWDAAEGRVVRLLGAVRDITERKRAEEQLQTYAGQLQALSRRLLEVQEQERRAFARELHDEIGQALTGLELILERSRGLPAGQVVASLTEMQALVRELTSRVRDLSLRLRPTMLDDLGLLPTLLWHLKGFGERTRMEVQFTHSGLDRRFGPEVETAAYRIVQEALTNVARHAGTRTAAVRAWRDGNTLYLLVEDGGVGFDDHVVRAGRASSGLSGMQERAALLGGRLHVESRPGAGTRVTAELPLGDREARRSDDAPSHAGG